MMLMMDSKRVRLKFDRSEGGVQGGGGRTVAHNAYEGSRIKNEVSPSRMKSGAKG